MEYHYIEEYKIKKNLRDQIKGLLKTSFPTYPDRSYYKQLPDFRFYATDNGEVVGQVGIEHRVIRVNKMPSRIFGIVDLCVHPTYTQKGIASELVGKVEELGIECEIDFIMLFADDQKFYSKKGFKTCDNTCVWLMINNHQSLGLARRSLADCMMIKAVGKKRWKTGEVDLMGIVFQSPPGKGGTVFRDPTYLED